MNPLLVGETQLITLVCPSAATQQCTFLPKFRGHMLSTILYPSGLTTGPTLTASAFATALNSIDTIGSVTVQLVTSTVTSTTTTIVYKVTFTPW